MLRRERGSVLVSGLLLALALVMVLGAAVDIGHAFIVRRELVAAADGAALTASQALDLEALHEGNLLLDPNAARAAAARALAGTAGVATEVTASPQTVTVRLERRLPTVLLRVVGLPSLTVSASATAAPRAP